MKVTRLFNFPRIPKLWVVRARTLPVWLITLFPLAAWSLEKGQTVPECPAATTSSQQALNLAGYRGKVILIDFWATWCGPCKKSMPFLNGLHNQLQKEGLEVVAINVDENTQDALDFLKVYPVDYHLAFDPKGVCPQIFDVKAMPSSYLVDRQGKIHLIHLGFRDGDEALIRKQVKDLLSH